MPTKLLQLADRWIADDGTVVCTHDRLMGLARDLGDPSLAASEPDPRTDRYNSISAKRIRIVSDDGEVTGPDPSTLGWTTPEPFASADLADLIRFGLESMGLQGSQEHLDRAAAELAEIEAREMTGMVRHVAWMVHDWRQRGVVWGVGRGSSCASLVLYLVGLHRIDPIRWRVPMEEFFR